MSVGQGGSGTATPALVAGAKIAISGSWPNQTIATTGAAASGANSDITSLTGLTTPLSVGQGGSGTATPALVAGAKIAISGSWPNQTIATTGAAASGANSDITSLTGLTTPLSVAQGGSGTATPALVAGTRITLSGSWPNQTINADVASLATAAVGYTITGGGSVITTGIAGVGLRVPFACTINSVTLLASPSGSIVIDIWKDTYANFPPTVADSICASAKPTISSGTKSEDTTLTGWTTSIAAGDVLYFNVDSCSTITNVVLVLRVTKA